MIHKNSFKLIHHEIIAAMNDKRIYPIHMNINPANDAYFWVIELCKFIKIWDRDNKGE